MKAAKAVHVGVRELKNHLTNYLRLVRDDREVIVTDRGKPVAVLRSLTGAEVPDSLEARIARLCAKGEITAPKRRFNPKMRRVKIPGPPLSVDIVNDRR